MNALKKITFFCVIFTITLFMIRTIQNQPKSATPTPVIKKPLTEEQELAWNQRTAEGQYKIGRLSEEQATGTNRAEIVIGWYQNSAQRGYALSQCRIGKMYQKGEILEQDFVKAYAWANLPSAKAHECGSKLNSELSDILSPEQVKTAQLFSSRIASAETITGACFDSDDYSNCN